MVYDKRTFVTQLVLLLSVANCLWVLTPVLVKGASLGGEVHDVAVTNIVIFPGNGSRVYFCFSVIANVTVENQGTSNETFNVTLYAGKAVNLTIQTWTVTDLAPGLNTTLTVEWYISPDRLTLFPPPWHPFVVMETILTIKAEADAVPDETDLTDNLYVDGVIYPVWMVPDIYPDGVIDIADIYLIAMAYGTQPGEPRWDPICDTNSDAIIDIQDIYFSAVAFGMSYE